MRLDKYLKVSRLIKRRTIAKEASESGRVVLNGKIAKPSAEVNVGDIIEIKFAKGVLKAKINSIMEHTQKKDAILMYEILENAEEC